MILQQQITFLFLALRIKIITGHICLKQNAQFQLSKRKDSPRRLYMYFLENKLGFSIRILLVLMVCGTTWIVLEYTEKTNTMYNSVDLLSSQLLLNAHKKEETFSSPQMNSNSYHSSQNPFWNWKKMFETCQKRWFYHLGYPGILQVTCSFV